MGNNSKSKITPYLYLVPCMLIFGVFLFYPFVKTIYLSLYKTNKMGQAKLYVGLDNYKESNPDLRSDRGGRWHASWPDCRSAL